MARADVKRDADLVALGQELRRARELAGLSQLQAAQQLGEAKNTISDRERGVIGVSLSALAAMGRLYGRSFRWPPELPAAPVQADPLVVRLEEDVMAAVRRFAREMRGRRR